VCPPDQYCLFGACLPRCGNDICDGDEDYLSCPGDCQADCGQGGCQAMLGETACTCPADCGTCPACCTGMECISPSTDAQCGQGGASCTACTGQELCVAGTCLCQPACDGKDCGPDGCGGICGVCVDGLSCTDDSCEEGACIFDINEFYCIISTTCVPSGTEKPGNMCRKCLPNVDQEGWSDAPDGFPCGTGKFCHQGACCDPVANCVGKDCGDDGCGGSCGECGLCAFCVDSGICEPFPEGTDPNDVCGEALPETCDDDGWCNGKGACRKWPGGTICSPKSCTGSTRSPTLYCDGDGTCLQPTESCESLEWVGANGNLGDPMVCGESDSGAWGCHSGKTFYEATQICADAGGRLCTLEELLADETHATGCGFDNRRLWTLSECGEDAFWTAPGKSSSTNSYPVLCAPRSIELNVRCCADRTSCCPYLCDGDECSTACDGPEYCCESEDCQEGYCGCVPDCQGKECGDDGCDGTCGACVEGEICDDGGCECDSACDGKECGADGCGGHCGECGAGKACNGSGHCQSTDGFGLEWITIPGNDIDMGCSAYDLDCEAAEEPVHPVTVSVFEVTETEITQGQYEAVTGETPSLFGGCPDCPVEQVSWADAKVFCEAVGGRLPSEAEWEYAARGPEVEGLPYFCGILPECLDGIAWYLDNAGDETHAVKIWDPNGFGLYDVLGNVREWVEDCWHDDYTDAPTTGEVWTGGDCSWNVLRGGSWDSDALACRVSDRFEGDPVAVDGRWGFRCARECVPDCTGNECCPDGCEGICGTCGDDEYCDVGQCLPLCGNGLCIDAGEDCVTCPADCGCDPDLEECIQAITGGMACAVKMVEIPAGNFWMGCNNCAGSTVIDTDCDYDEHPYHKVYLDIYEMDRTEVTASQYLACVSASGCTPAGTGSYVTYEVAGKEDHPINYVDWFQAGAYCQWAGKELCTEAQWEKGARGGCEHNGGPSSCKSESRKYPWGNDVPTCDLAVKVDCPGDPHPVCSKSPLGDSPYGLCDLAGNVREWTADWFGSDYYCEGSGADTSSPWTYCTVCGSWPGSPSAWSNPMGPGSGSTRVGRGGSFYFGDAYLRVSYRRDVDPSGIHGVFGFRCCRDSH